MAALVGALTCLIRVLPASRAIQWGLIALACAYHPAHISLWLGQSSTVLLLGLCGAYTALKLRRELLAGVALSLLALKPQLLLPFIVLLLIQRRWKSLAALIGMLVACSVAAMPVLGVAWPLHYAQFLLSVRNWGGNLAEHPARMYNWRAFAIHIAELSAPTLATPLFLSLLVTSVGLIVLASWYGNRAGGNVVSRTNLPFAPAYDLSWALVSTVAVLLPVHLYHHDFTLLILPAWIVAVYATSGQWDAARSSLWLVVLAAGFALAPLEFLTIANPALAIVSNVALLAAAIALLAQQLAAARQVVAS